MQYFIVNECKTYITEFRDSIQINIEKYQADKLKLNSDDIKNKNEINFLNAVINNSIEVFDILEEVLDDNSQTTGFTKYFDMRYTCSNNLSTINATVFFDLNIFDYSQSNELKHILIKYNFIELKQYKLESLDLNKVFMTWQQFGLIVSVLNHGNNIIKQRTLYYYNNIERAFDTYHDMIKKYINLIKPTGKDAHKVISFFERIVAKTYQEEFNEITKTETVISSLINKFKTKFSF
ncbi:MAG: hypothetical protein ACRCZI_13050 [Cetobacterium sp.]